MVEGTLVIKPPKQVHNHDTVYQPRGETAIPLAPCVFFLCVYARAPFPFHAFSVRLRSHESETFWQNICLAKKRHQSARMHIDSNHKLDPFTRHRASHISKVSLKHSIASPSACYMKENTVVSYDMLCSPFTEPNFKEALKPFHCPIGLVFPGTFSKKWSGGGRVIYNLAH